MILQRNSWAGEIARDWEEPGETTGACAVCVGQDFVSGTSWFPEHYQICNPCYRYNSNSNTIIVHASFTCLLCLDIDFHPFNNTVSNFIGCIPLGFFTLLSLYMSPTTHSLPSTPGSPSTLNQAHALSFSNMLLPEGSSYLMWQEVLNQ